MGMSLLRRSDPIMPEGVFTPDDLVPPVAIAQIDAFLADLSRRHSLGAREAQDMLLDVRNVIWRPTVHSEAAGDLLASQPARGRPLPKP